MWHAALVHLESVNLHVCVREHVHPWVCVSRGREGEKSWTACDGLWVGRTWGTAGPDADVSAVTLVAI